MSSLYENKPSVLSELIKVANLENTLKRHRNRKVTFDENVNVTHIISREEINEFNLKECIWWNLNDYEKFYEESRQDVFKFMLKFPGIDYFSARKILYNQNYIDIMDTINE